MDVKGIEKEPVLAFLNGKESTKSDLVQLHRAYVTKFSDDQGKMIMKDLKGYCMVDFPFGSNLSLQELQHRATLLDLYNYISGMSSVE